MNLNFDHLLRDEFNYFLKIVKFGTLSKASEKLEIGQPSLSKALSRLETKINSKLFFRTRSGLQLTPEGENLYQRINSLKDLFSTSEGNTHDLWGEYKIGLHNAIAHFLTPRYLSKLLLKYPSLKLKTMLMESRKVVEYVCKGDIDLGIVVNPKPLPDLVIKNITSEKSYLYGKNESSNILFYNSEMVQILSNISKIKNISSFDRIEAIDDYGLIAELVKSKSGVGLLPENLANSYDLNKFHEQELLNVDISLVYRYELTSNSVSKLLIDQFFNHIA